MIKVSKHIDELNKHIEDIEIEMTRHCISYTTLIECLIKIPNISYLVAMTIIAAISVEVSQFETDKESANKKQ